MVSAVFSGGAGGARAPPEFGDSQKGRETWFCLSEFSYYYEHPWIWKTKYGTTTVVCGKEQVELISFYSFMLIMIKDLKICIQSMLLHNQTNTNIHIGGCMCQNPQFFFNKPWQTTTLARY